MESTSVLYSPTQRVYAPEHVLMQEIAGQSALLNLKSELYFGLDEIGTAMWKALTSSNSIKQACEHLLNEYDVEPDQLRKDVMSLLSQLVEHDLVIVKDE